MLGKSAIASMAFLVGATLAANAQQPYPSWPNPQFSAVPIVPPAVAPAGRAAPPASWYADPYTNGSTTCPEGGDDFPAPKCSVLIPRSQRLN